MIQKRALSEEVCTHTAIIRGDRISVGQKLLLLLLLLLQPIVFSLQLNLVCDSGVLASLLMSLQFVGVALGSVVMGQAGDTFGRRLVAMVSTAFIALFGTVISFTWNVYLMAVLRLCLGFVLPV